MKSFRGGSSQQTRQPSGTYDKNSCQLAEFPIIKLHILQNIQKLNLSHNLICDLTALQLHLHTSEHVLCHLRSVDLSSNKLPNAAALAPLASAAISLKELAISDNPLTRTLNFLYQLVLMFKQITEITHSNTLYVDEDFRVKVVQFQLKGGALIVLFLERVYMLTRRAVFNRDYQWLEGIKGVFDSLKPHQNSVLEHNEMLFHAMRRFLELCRLKPDQTNFQTYDSPQMLHQSGQIDAISEYQIRGRSNHLTRYLSEQSEQPQAQVRRDQPPNTFCQFYYSAVLDSKSIQLKLLQEVEVSQEQNQKLQRGECSNFDKQVLQSQLLGKWHKQAELTQGLYPQITPHSVPTSASSPFKSIQTQISTQRDFVSSPARGQVQNVAFFGLEREWTMATHTFVVRRMMYFLKHMGTMHNQPEKNFVGQNYGGSQRESSQAAKQEQEKAEPFQKYVTFGRHVGGADVTQFQVQSGHSDQDSLDVEQEASPKARNKYIVSTCLNFLQQIVSKIVFRRIKSTYTVKPFQITYLAESFQKLQSKALQEAFRKIAKYALFVEYLTNKMKRYKLQKVFKQWKLIKRRKLKLIKSLLNRKFKKEAAFLSVIMAQWRVASSHLKLEESIRKKREMWSVECPLSEMSGIIVRSATQNKLAYGQLKRYTGPNSKQTKRKQY